jgi:hypothetical protein
MKRSVFIIIGVVLVLILVAVWVYMLFFSTTSNETDKQFGDLDFGETTDTDYQEPVVEEEPVVDMETNQRLRQLTTRPVAGFTEILSDTNNPRTVLYMEIGTGHIYSINLISGEEERISATTIAETQKAEFSQDGTYVMIQSGFETKKEFILGEIHSTSSTLSNTKLAEPITSFSGTVDNQFLYTIQTNASTIGKVLDPSDVTNETLFTLPLREANVEWGSAASDSHYVYPKATRHLENFLYQIKNGVVSRMPVDGYGMSALGNDTYVFYSKKEGAEYRSYYLDINSRIETNVPLSQIPEKCVMSEEEYPVTVCANTEYELPELLPDSWYKGEISTADNLWEISPDGGAAKFLISPELTSGRKLDITQLQITSDKSKVYFTNQSDQTLWFYQRIIAGVN